MWLTTFQILAVLSEAADPNSCPVWENLTEVIVPPWPESERESDITEQPPGMNLRSHSFTNESFPPDANK